MHRGGGDDREMELAAVRAAADVAAEDRVADEVHDYLLQLDQLRQDCERRGDFLKAHECVNRMREVNLRFARRIEGRSHQTNVDTKSRCTKEQQTELAAFSRMWEDKLADYDAKAEDVVADMKRRHAADYLQQETALKVQLMNRRPRFSRQVVELRDALEKHVRLRDYLAAEEVKQKLAVLEQGEINAFDDSLAVTFERKAQTLKQQYIAELNAVQQKIVMGREELLTQRRLDFEKLLRRHNNVMREIDQETKLHVARTQHYVRRQVKALVLDPVKTGMELRGAADSLKDGFALRRSRTPLTGHRGTRVAGAGGSPHDTSLSSVARTTDDSGRYGW